MFIAYAASLRSGSLSRQVGAAISTPDGDILATGANDVPRFRGGQYWPGKDDQRDLVRGLDANEVEKRALAVRVIRAFTCREDITDEVLDTEFRVLLKETGLLDITEYGRDVHAEMEAISSCARNGISVRGAVLYTTTFPCHNCAKHIVAAGIQRVYYVEPYPKSRAMKLHDDAIELSAPTGEKAGNKVLFSPFVGVGPRRFFDLFSLKLGSGRPLERKEGRNRLTEEKWRNKGPRVPLPYLSYLQREQIAAAEILPLLGTDETTVEKLDEG